MICGAERRGSKRGRCATGVVPDCSGKTHELLAEEHVDKGAHVRSDGWGGIAAGLKGWEGLDQRRFDAVDADASLPTVHHVISNFQSWALGTFHGLSLERLHSPLNYMSPVEFRLAGMSL